MLGRLQKHVRNPETKSENGQIVILTAFVMVVMLAFAGLVIDGGLLTQERRNLQNAADAMALAGASQIQAGGAGNGQAEAEARIWGTRNGVSAEEIVEPIQFGVTCTGETEPNSITVRVRREKQTFLMEAVAKLLKEDEPDTTVGACATAARYSLGGGVGVAPFGMEISCIYGPDEIPGTADDWSSPGDMITIKYDSQNTDGDEPPCSNNQGNFWLLGIDDSGAGEPCGSPEPASYEERKLREAICFGSITPLCTPDAEAQGEICETHVDTQTGNVTSIRDSLDYLVDTVDDDCDTLAEIVKDGDLVDECNPFLPGFEGVSLVKIIPVLDGLYPDANGKSNVLIADFLIVVIDPDGIDECSGSDCDIEALVLEEGVIPSALRKQLDENSTKNFSVLIK